MLQAKSKPDRPAMQAATGHRTLTDTYAPTAGSFKLIAV